MRWGRLQQLILAFMVGLLFATVLALALVHKKGRSLMHKSIGEANMQAKECLYIISKGK